MGWNEMETVLARSQLRNAERLLVIIVATHIGKDYDYSFPGYERLARECGCSVRYVHKLVEAVIDGGELILEKRPGKLTRWYVPLYPGEPGYTPEDCDLETSEHLCNGWHTPLWVSRRRERERAEERDALAAREAHPRPKTRAPKRPKVAELPEDAPQDATPEPDLESTPASVGEPTGPLGPLGPSGPSGPSGPYRRDNFADRRRWERSPEGREVLAALHLDPKKLSQASHVWTAFRDWVAAHQPHTLDTRPGEAREGEVMGHAVALVAE